MDTHNRPLAINAMQADQKQSSGEAEYNNQQHFSDGRELIPAEVAEKGLQAREKPLTPYSEMMANAGQGKQDGSPSPRVQPAYRVTDSGLINAYPVSPPMAKVDPLGKKQVDRYVLGFGLAANFALGLVVLTRFITGQT